MHLSTDKVHDLAEQVLAHLRSHPQVELLAAEPAVKSAIGGVILDDMAQEREIDREVDELLDSHAREIEDGDLDFHLLRGRFKREIARRRGFTL